MHILRFGLCLLLVFCLLCGVMFPAVLADSHSDQALIQASNWLLQQVPTPGYGDEWVVFSLQTSGVTLPGTYLSGYAQSLRTVLAERNGILSTTKATDYASVILALTAAGYDASSFGGWDLTKVLQDMSFVEKQGLNGIIYSLLCLDYGNYACSNRTALVDTILSLQLSDGGWALSGTKADPDVTAMALQALASYSLRCSVAAAIEKGIHCLSSQQNADGSFSSWGTVNCESGAQVLLALGELGISAFDSRFTGSQTFDSVLLSFQTADGGFSHTKDGQAGVMATSQALLALCSISRLSKGSGSVYGAWTYNESARFSDLSGRVCAPACGRVIQAGLMQGVSSGLFDPDGTLTRAMAVTILWRLAGSPVISGANPFTDIPVGAYYAKAAVWGSQTGVVQGTGASSFSPNQTVTRQELAVLLWRYTASIGKSTALNGRQSGRTDAAKADSWAVDALHWAYGLDLMGSELLAPKGPATRGETAQMFAGWMEVYG